MLLDLVISLKQHLSELKANVSRAAGCRTRASIVFAEGQSDVAIDLLRWRRSCARLDGGRFALRLKVGNLHVDSDLHAVRT